VVDAFRYVWHACSWWTRLVFLLVMICLWILYCWSYSAWELCSLYVDIDTYSILKLFIWNSTRAIQSSSQINKSFACLTRFKAILLLHGFFVTHWCESYPERILNDDCLSTGSLYDLVTNRINSFFFRKNDFHVTFTFDFEWISSISQSAQGNNITDDELLEKLLAVLCCWVESIVYWNDNRVTSVIFDQKNIVWEKISRLTSILEKTWSTVE
jgi:hypothetical protein